MKSLYISPGRLRTTIIDTPENVEDFNDFLSGDPFKELKSTQLPRADLVCIHADCDDALYRSDALYRPDHFSIMGTTIEGAGIVVRYDQLTGAQMDLTKDDIQAVIDSLIPLGIAPEKDPKSLTVDAEAKKLSFDEEDLLKLGKEAFLSSFGPDQKGKRIIELKKHIDPRIFPKRCDFRARHGMTIFRSVAQENGSNLLEIGHLKDGSIKRITATAFTANSASLDPVQLVSDCTANIGIPAERILTTAIALPIYSGELGLISPGVSKSDVATYQAALQIRLERESKLKDIPIHCQGGSKGRWVDATKKIELIKFRGLSVPDEFDPKDRLFVLVSDETVQAGIVVPQDPSGGPSEWPFGGAVLVRSPQDTALTYKGALMNLMRTILPQDVTAASVVEKIVETELDPHAGFENLEREESGFEP